MKIVDLKRYRKVNRKTTAFADNDNTGGRLQTNIERASIFRSVSGEQLVLITTDSGIVVKIAAGYAHRFE
jgi:hypothetical protein